FVDVECPSADLRTIERRDGFLPIFCTGHFYEAKAARAAGITVSHNADAVHLSVRLEHLAQFFFRSIEIQVSYEDVFHGTCLGLSYLNEGRLRAEEHTGRRALGAGASDLSNAGAV